MRRFEFREGASNKFWQIDLDGSSVTVTWGKIGTSGSTQTKSFASAAAARKEHDKLVAEKLNKGYAEPGRGAPADSAKKPAPAAASVPMEAGGVKVVLDPSLKLRGSRTGQRGQWKKQTPASLEKAVLERIADGTFQIWTGNFKDGTPRAKGELGKLQAAIVKAFRAKKLPRAASPAELAATFRVFESVDTSGTDALVRYWIETAGPVAVLQAIAETFRIVVRDDDDSDRWLEAVPEKQTPGQSRALYASFRWGQLREYLLACDDATYAEAVKAAAQLRGESLRLRAAITELFPDETAWVTEDLRAWTKAMADQATRAAYENGGCPGYLLAGVTPPLLQDATDFVQAINPRYSVDVTMIGELLSRCGVAAEAIAVDLAWRSADHRKLDKVLAQELSQISSPGAARFFTGRLDQKEWRPACMDYFRAYPEVAVAALKAEIADAESEVKGEAREVLKSLTKKS